MRSLVPFPARVDDLTRIVDDATGYVESGDSRRLSSASVDEGGITVKAGGKIIVEDGGNLEITTGNLVLPDGVIRPEWLRESIIPDMTIHQGKYPDMPVGTTRVWRETFTKPATADKTLFFIIIDAKIYAGENDMAMDDFYL